MEKVAIITVNYNGKKDTLEFLESMKGLQVFDSKGSQTRGVTGLRLQGISDSRGYRSQTIVVDNGSSDGSVSAICKQFPNVDILQTGANLGFSGGFNRGLDYAKIWGADYFLLINNDCLIKDSSLISELLKTMKSDSKIGLVSPKIYFAKGFEFHNDRYKEQELGSVIWYAGGKFDWDNIASIHRGIDEVDRGQYEGVEETGIFSGACVLIRKEVLEKLGGLDEKYFLYFEDSDLVKRAQDAGFKIYYNGRVAIYHKVSQSTGIGSNLTDYYHTRNRLIFGMRYGRSRTKFALLREALQLFIFGRPVQRRGVLDYYLGIKDGVNLTHTWGGIDSHLQVEYSIKLSIGIVNYNTPDLVNKLLESIFDKASGFKPEEMEVIVLDNGLIDSCKDKIQKFLLASQRSGPKIKYLVNQDNEGFTRGYNKTIRFSLGEYYLMLNSDIEVLRKGISELVAAEDDFKGEAVVGGKLLFPDMSDQDSVFHLPTLTGAIREYFLAQSGSYFMFLPKTTKPTKVEGLVMACLLIPRKILNKIGLLDEGTFIFFEDIEYARRLKKFNIPVYFVPSARFIHLHGGSTKRIGQKKANEQLIVAAEHYHGKIYCALLSFVLRLGQKLGRIKTPVTKWES